MQWRYGPAPEPARETDTESVVSQVPRGGEQAAHGFKREVQERQRKGAQPGMAEGPSQDGISVVKVIFGHQSRGEPTLCHVQMRHSRGGTQINAADSRQLQAEIDILIHRRTMQEKIREATRARKGVPSNQAMA